MQPIRPQTLAERLRRTPTPARAADRKRGMDGQPAADAPPVKSQTIEVPADENNDPNEQAYNDLGINPQIG